jgi:hypothetical protein
MNRPHNNTVLEKVRQVFADADQAGEARPGRPTLVRMLAGASEHQVRTAMDALAMRAADSPPGHHQNGTRLNGNATAGSSSCGTTLDAEPAGEKASAPLQTTDPGPHQPARPPRAWPLAFIGLAAAVAVWGGWVDLGRSTGFGMVQPLPGLVDGLWINTAIVLPIGIEAYGGYALRTWLSAAALSEPTRRYALWSALASLVVGAGAQVASHLMRAVHITVAPWGVTVVVSCVPVIVLGLATGLATLVRQDTTSTTTSPVNDLASP